MKTRSRFAAMGLALLVIVVSGCSVDIARNTDGSLNLSGTITQASLQSEIDAALADPLIEDLQVDLRTDHVLVTAQRRRLQGSDVDELTFRLDLNAVEGRLTAVISQAEINGAPFNDSRVALWNERIADRLERVARRRPNSTLQSIQITAEGVTMIWRVETPRSRR